MEMKNSEIGIVHDASELRMMIAKHTDLPIVVLAGEEANSGDYCWMYCNDVTCSIEYILDVKTPYDQEHVFTDMIEFEETVCDALYDKYSDCPDEEYDAAIKAEIDKYKPYWKRVIAVYASN